MARKHNLDEVLRTLGKKKDVKVTSKSVMLLTGKVTPKSNDLGNNSWGKIDFLVNHAGYKLTRVDEFPKNN